ncbi:helix-turn-helix domain-containing protein [Streptomyces sp. JJ36]|uniref:AraC-like ligand-binding domain-containing protein n=1 Tax=Streptomyces sp. JJ36 TaxID=2736645 RepID=UPI001F006F0B|nr:helix-turn-helix domain-containing protein [Streptomyces sp. JJ36]MCF6526498.1 helix-turn-helix domain-containing protein [Streptomyces sp. JJ36]
MGDCVDVSVDGVGQWAEITALALVTTRIKAVEPGRPFTARLRAMPLGVAQLSELSYGALLSQRTPRLIRQSDPELLQVVITASGRQRIDQARNTAVVGSGQMVLYDSSRPFDAHAGNSPAGTTPRGAMLQFPKAMLPFPAPRLNSLLAVPLSARRGPGRLLAQFLTTAATEYPACTPADAARLGTTAVDLATAVLAHHLDRERDVPADSRKRALYLRITAFIQIHLADDALTAGRIAAAHHISVRSLHRLFQEHGVSVRSWMRDQRMERCRRDLADPLQHHLPVSAIAARWGFPRPADFTRAFRARHGITPSTYRDQAHRCRTVTGTQHQAPGTQS